MEDRSAPQLQPLWLRPSARRIPASRAAEARVSPNAFSAFERSRETESRSPCSWMIERPRCVELANRFDNFDRPMTAFRARPSASSVVIQPQSSSDIFPSAIWRDTRANENRSPTICSHLIFVRCLKFQRSCKPDVNSKILESGLGLALRETARSISVNPKGPVRQHRISFAFSIIFSSSPGVTNE